jgi:hypothetical protein
MSIPTKNQLRAVVAHVLEQGGVTRLSVYGAHRYPFEQQHTWHALAKGFLTEERFRGRDTLYATAKGCRLVNEGAGR